MDIDKRVRPRTAIYGRNLIVALREPEDHERALSCNGCTARTVYRVLETGSVPTDGHGGSASVFRMCRECTRLFHVETGAEAIALDRAELAAAVREHNQGKTLHPEMTVDCVARSAVLRLIEGEKGADHAD